MPQAGTVWINTYGLYDNAMPFGGMKQSGYGASWGRQASWNTPRPSRSGSISPDRGRPWPLPGPLARRWRRGRPRARRPSRQLLLLRSDAPADAAILDARIDPAVHVLVLRGAGDRFFCAGADIGMLQSVTPGVQVPFCLHANETLLRLSRRRSW
jgi:hypothetical protein